MISKRDQPDFSRELTVFVSTVGYATFNECLKHLHEQDCGFKLEVIDHVAPMSAAFQRMMEQCSTPYFVQVDEDMLLFPHAIRTLYEHFTLEEPNVAQIVYALYDVHLEEVIYGIKIYRHSIVRKYPFNDIDGCEWDQIRRFREDGYIDIRMPIDGATRDFPVTLGLHGTYWTPHAVYIRYAMLERRRRKGNRTHDWVVDTAAKLMRRFLTSRSDIDLYALMGLCAGSLTDRLATDRERDYRGYEQTPGLKQLERFVSDVRAAWGEGEAVDPRTEVDVLR
jgi:hypothetical protein